MWGMACKGLHCAGCGKGIPAGAVIILVIVAIVGRNANAISSALMEFVIGAAVVVFLAVAIAGAAVYRLMHQPERTAILTGRWEGQSMTTLTGPVMANERIGEWPYRTAYRPAISPRFTIPAEWPAEEMGHERRADMIE